MSERTREDQEPPDGQRSGPLDPPIDLSATLMPKPRKKANNLHPSNFNGQIFVPHDNSSFRHKRNYANSLYYGTDLGSLKRVQDRIDTLIDEGELPSSYNLHNPIQLMPDRTFDTTNRSSVLQAQQNNFDPEGFRQGKPLKLSIFYLDPFVTCSWCNMLTFVDVMAIRRSLALPEDLAEDLDVPLENLPPCRRCGKANHLEVGSHDFTDLIANRDRVAREKAERELSAVLVLQRAYRGYLRRMYAHAERAARIALEKLQAKAATRINACARYRLANRRAVAEYHLAVVKNSHPVLLDHALKQPRRPDRRYNIAQKTFWFERDVEKELVFVDYTLLGERLGWQPTRRQMEVNFIELSRRITARKDDLLSLIQRAWRGFMARRIVVYFKVEVVRLQQFLLSKAFKIQRLYRGHAVRIKIPAMLRARDDERVMRQYANFAEKRRLRRLRTDAVVKTKSAYIKERGEERTARYTGRIDAPALHNDRKMKAFAASCYSDNRLPNEMDNLLGIELREIAENKKQIKDDHDRKVFLTGRINEHGPRGFGNRGFIDESVEEKVIAGIVVGPERISSRSKGMKLLMNGEIKEIMERVVERALHDHRGHRLPERFQAFNKEKEEFRGAGLLANIRREGGQEGSTFALYKSGGGDATASSSSTSPSKSRAALLQLPNAPGIIGVQPGERERAGSPGPKNGKASPKRGDKNWHTGTKKMARKRNYRRFKDYQFPKGINDDAMAFLNDDLDDLLAYADEKAKKEAASQASATNSANATPKATSKVLR